MAENLVAERGKKIYNSHKIFLSQNFQEKKINKSPQPCILHFFEEVTNPVINPRPLGEGKNSR